jgi:PAS domain S-box-containing protein
LNNVDRLRQQTTLAKFGELALRSDSQDEILTEACRLIGEGLGTDLAKVMELQADGVTLLVRAGVGWKPGIVGKVTLKVTDNTSEGLALKSGKPMISPDIATETRFTYPDFLIDNGVKAVANVVIIGGEGRPPFGILQIDSRIPRHFTESDTSFLRTYANLIAAAVDRLRGIEEMRDGQAWLRLAMEAGRLGSWQLDLTSGDMTNAMRVMQIFGVDPLPVWNYDALLKHVFEEDRELVESTFRKAAGTRLEWYFQCRIQRADDGTVRWIEARGRATGSRGNVPPNNMLGIVSDITERKTTEEWLEEKIDRRNQELVEVTSIRNEAERANRAKSRFLASMSHELRTPLNGVLGYAHLMHQEGELNPKQSERVQAMLTAGTHLLGMINRVLNFSEIEAGGIVLQPAEIDVRDTMVMCLDMVRSAAEAKGLRLSFVDAPGASNHLISDPTRFRQVLINLLGNAIKFTTTGGVELRLQTSSDGAGIRVEVADTGPGIPIEVRHRLFQDFERLDIDSTLIEGAGLGLAISAQLVGLLGGRLAYSDNPSGGSVFWLEMPLVASVPGTSVPAAIATLEMPQATAASAPSNSLRVLVVDDAAMNLDITASFLRFAGHDVTCAENGMEAVAAAAASDFDVVLMDVRMPGMDGLEATRRIRQFEGARGRVPIVALTAQVFSEQVTACRMAGMNDHLAKPFTPETLLVAVQHATRTRPERSLTG